MTGTVTMQICNGGIAVDMDVYDVSPADKALIITALMKGLDMSILELRTVMAMHELDLIGRVASVHRVESTEELQKLFEEVVNES